ncbi:TlpA family protein disulfide reductase [Gracilibacillus oryzae]|nr:redoxin domain-containing protein [Gracilibacillus oryzae]
MKRNILASVLIIVLIGIVVYTNFPGLFNQADNSGPNEFNVTGDTSVDGEYITAPNLEILKEGMTAPDIVLENLQGEELNVKNIESNFVFVNFWATWCQPCLKEMPDLQKIEQEYNDIVQVVAVNATNVESRHKNDVVKDYITDGGYDFTVLLDKEGKIYEQYSIINLPTTFIVRQSDQQIVKRINGMMTYEQMEQYVKELQTK